MPVNPRVALIHATPVAIEPIHEALKADWPDARAVNILDDSLSPDRALAAQITPELSSRIADLAVYARKIGADAILFTCSAFGPAIEAATALVDAPVLKPNEAMFDAAISRGRRIAMIATFEPSRETMEAEFAEAAAQRDPAARLTTVIVAPAMAALRAGDAATHNRLVAEAAASLTGYDAIMLAHFSTSRAAAAVRAVTQIPVLSSPAAAVEKLRSMVAARQAQRGE